MDILEKVAGQIPAEAVTAAKQHIAQSGISDAEVVSDVSGDGVDAEVISLDSGESAKVISADDEFEVLEISSPESSPSQNEGVEVIEVVSPARTKLRPNDKVNVQYPDGKIEYSVKWKKVKKSVEKGECKVVG